MQLKTLQLSKLTATLLLASTVAYTENYVSVEYLHYDESDDRVTVQAPMVEVSYDLTSDYALKINALYDAISGATPTILSHSRGNYSHGTQYFEDERKAASAILTKKFDNKDELYVGIDFSREEDFESLTSSLEYMHYLDATHNTAISFGGSIGKNRVQTYDSHTGASDKIEDFTGYNFQLGVTQVLTQESSVKLSAFTIQDSGYLTNPHGHIVRNLGRSNERYSIESRPDKRSAYGMSGHYNHLLTPTTSYIGSYRFYNDDWDITSHTIESDLYTRLTKQMTLGVGLRYYTQTAASFYNPTINHFTNEKYASSDERLSKFDAWTYKTSIDFKVDNALSYNIGIQYYKQSTDLTATFFTIGAKYRF
jgi:hypothetical protein